MLTLPTPKTEAWKFTNLAQAHAALPEAENPTLSLPDLEAMLPVISGPQMVFYKGVLVPELCTPLPKGVTLTKSGATLAGPSNALDALDSLATAQSWQLTITQSQPLPLILIHIGHGSRTAGVGVLNLSLAAGLQATVVEIHTAPENSGWQHHGAAFTVEEGAHLTHSVLNLSPANPHLLSTRRQRLNLAEGATYTGTLGTFGGGMLRTENHTTLTSKAHYGLISLACPTAAQHHDVTLQTRFKGVGATANIRQRTLQLGESHAVFQGKFFVEAQAQKTDAYMHTHTLLLADTARVSTKPELEIYADDVKCSHGAACGGLNPQQLFYLKARGLPEAQARALLVQGFADDFMAAFPPSAHALMARYFQGWLQGKAPVAQLATDFSTDWLANTKANPEPRTVVREMGDDL